MGWDVWYQNYCSHHNSLRWTLHCWLRANRIWMLITTYDAIEWHKGQTERICLWEVRIRRFDLAAYSNLIARIGKVKVGAGTIYFSIDSIGSLGRGIVTKAVSRHNPRVANRATRQSLNP